MARRKVKGKGWWGEKYRHSLAAKKGWKKRKHKKKSRTVKATSFPKKTSSKPKHQKKDKGLFKPAKHKDIAEIVSFETPKSAARSANILLAELQHTKDRNRALVIARALQYASNRAKASTKRKNLSESERRQLSLISKIYGSAAQVGWKIYRARFEE